LREAFPFHTATKYLVFDRDSIFSAELVTVLRSMGLQPTRISFRSHWQNGVAERFVGTLRHELLDHTVVLNDCHLRRLLSAFVEYYHQDRTHLGLYKDTPLGPPTKPRAEIPTAIVAQPRGRRATPPLVLARSGVTGTQRTSTRDAFESPS
jgi:transposase InsO family protein